MWFSVRSYPRRARDRRCPVSLDVAKILGRPLDLPCGEVLPNRIAKAAMSECLGTPEGDPSARLIRLYETLGAGGAGMLLTGNVMVSSSGIGEPANVVWRSDSPIRAWQDWAAGTQRHGSRGWMQINHAGRQVPRTLNAHPVAPSAVAVAMAGVFARPRALESEEIESILDAFAAAAAFAQGAGFAGVQVHGAHGYLLNQFLSPLSNQRTDRWGGGLENRMRFALEAYRRIRGAVGANFPVAIKLNSADFLRGGFTSEESVVVARTLSEEGIDLLEVSGGTYEKPTMVSAPTAATAEREAHFLQYARLVRPQVGCPVMLTGGLRTPEAMARVIDEGAADVVGLGRPIAVNPNLPREILAGRLERAAGPKPGTGPLAAASETSWHQAQLHLLADGRDTEPDSSRWWAFAKTAWNTALGRGVPA